MKPANEEIATKSDPAEASLPALVKRLKALSQEPMFRLQRQAALNRALRPYAEYARFSLLPLPEETALADLYLVADYYPDDGQFSLIEQVRDMIEAHVPEDERVWLDPLKHSFMDLLEIMSIEETRGGRILTLRSLGSGKPASVSVDGRLHQVTIGQVLLTRLIRVPDVKWQADRLSPSDHMALPGAAVILAGTHARTILDSTNQWRRETEAESGSFELGEWEEFAKRYGYVLLWMSAKARMAALLGAEDCIQYRKPDTQPFLYALALYEHAEFDRLAEALNRSEGLQDEKPAPLCGGYYDPRAAHVWVQRDASPPEPRGDVLARVTLTSALLIVECETSERLNTLKHALASTLGYALHFMGESTAVPAHDVPEVDLRLETEPAHTVVITREEEYRLMKDFLDSVYLEWADRPSPALNGRTPRHAAATPDTRPKVAALIDQLERDDLAYHRICRRGYDYSVLRAHVGL